MEIKQKKTSIYYVLLCLGVCLLIAGIVFLCMSESHTGATKSGLVTASTRNKYGADFYSDSANYTGLAANAVVDLFAMVKLAIGVFFVFLGALESLVVLALQNSPCFVKTAATAIEEKPKEEAPKVDEPKENPNPAENE